MKWLIFLLVGFLLPTTTQAASLASQLAGRILLQVQNRGEAWYVNPLDLKRHSLGRPDDAWYLMVDLGLGITNSDLAQIPTSTQLSGGDMALRQRLAGRILLQVQNRGEAWYVDPVTLKRAYLGRPADALSVMKKYGLGITDANLAAISSAPLQTTSTLFPAVPFVAQAPFGEWSDPRQQDGCEEASALMAVAWARGESLSLEDAKTHILAMSDWEKDEFGYFEDTSVAHTASRLVADYLNFKKYEVQTSVTTNDLKRELAAGHILIVAVNGQTLNNPNFIGGGPERHMIVVLGYDSATNEFVTHDPGTQNGKNYRYNAATMAASLQDYASGNHAPIPSLPTAMIVLFKE